MADPTDPEQIDMRPEYDFSRGVRGKHVDRFVVTGRGRPPAWYREAVLFDRHAWIGEALRQVQLLEGILVTYLCLAFDIEPREAGKSVVAGLEGRQRGGLSRILEDLEDLAEASAPDLESRLEEALRERDWLVHRSLHDWGSGDLESTGALVLRLQALVKSAATVSDELRRLMKERFLDDGMTQAEYERRSSEVLRRWLVA